jgi:hypothetical protein
MRKIIAALAMVAALIGFAAAAHRSSPSTHQITLAEGWEYGG